jgi:hypothetical protein
MRHPHATADDLFHPDLVIRRADGADWAAVAGLAQLDSAEPLRGDVLIAEVAGELWAALSLQDGHGIADPFRPSAAALDLLRVRARHLAGTWPEHGARRRLGLRRAAA